jgi:hypothetical protein
MEIYWQGKNDKLYGLEILSYKQGDPSLLRQGKGTHTNI